MIGYNGGNLDSPIVNVKNMQLRDSGYFIQDIPKLSHNEDDQEGLA